MQLVITGHIECECLGESETVCVSAIDAAGAAGACTRADASQPCKSASQFYSQSVRLPGNLTSRVSSQPADMHK